VDGSLAASPDIKLARSPRTVLWAVSVIIRRGKLVEEFEGKRAPIITYIMGAAALAGSNSGGPLNAMVGGSGNEGSAVP
jgi:hypothetical protein